MSLVSTHLLISILTGASPPLSPMEPALTLHEAVRSAIENLAPLTQEKFASNIRLSLAVQLQLQTRPEDPAQIKRKVIGTAYGVLDSLEITPIGELRVSDDQNQAALDASAQAQGADWLLAFTVTSIDLGRHQVAVELRKTDTGLWGPMPQPTTIYAQASANYGASIIKALPTFKTGNVSQLHDLKEHIVAIQSCDLDPQYPGPELITLSSKKVAVFRAGSRFLTRLADVSIQHFPKSQSISRFPHGYILCPSSSDSSTTVIKVGHSNLTHGVNISVSAPGKLKLRASNSRQATMLSEKHNKLLASYASGRPWWSQFSPAIEQPTEVIGFLASFEGESTQGFVLSRNYELFSLDSKLQASATRITSGAGISAYQNHQQKPRFVTTSSISTQKEDRIRVQTRDGKILHEISTSLPVMTTTSLPGEETGATRILFASPRPEQGRTTIFHIEVSDP